MVAKKIRILVVALLLSASLNVLLIFDLIFQKTPIFFSKAATQNQKIETTNGKVLTSMSQCTFRELVSFLTNRDPVEEGYTKRDLALSALVAYHHFNLEKALSAMPQQVRTVILPNQETIDVFPGLSEEQYEAIIRFAYQEKWPLTARGLLAHLQTKQIKDESLGQAFFLTPEFYALQILFQKTQSPQEPQTLLKLCVEGNFDLLQKFAREQMQVLDFSKERRRALLLEYISAHSPTAAQLLLQTDFTFALKRLEDPMILALLSLLDQPSEKGKEFCLGLLRSLRGDQVWLAAARTLYSYVGEIPVQPIDPKAVLSRFSSGSSMPEKTLPKPHFCYHVVKEGETLWRIARQYKVKVDEIVKLNELEKDALFPGMTLRLPRSQGTGSEPPG